MLLLRHAAPIVGLVLLIAACQTTPAGTSVGTSPATAAAGSPAATGAEPTAASSATTTVSLADFGGTWTFVPSDPRVVSTIGDHAGGSVVITGNRYKFTAGEFSSEGGIEFSGTKLVSCTTGSCRAEGVPLHHLFLVDGQLAILHAATLEPLGGFGGTCAWDAVPEGGIVTVVSTGTVDGQEVPTVIRFADGAAGGVGTACEDGGYVVAWDVTATRQ